MNMKLDNPVQTRAKSLLSIDTAEERHELEKTRLHFAFLSGIERVMDAQNISREELAQRIGTSTSYLTELFRGTKPLNFDILAKMKIALDVDYKVEVVG